LITVAASSRLRQRLVWLGVAVALAAALVVVASLQSRASAADGAWTPTADQVAAATTLVQRTVALDDPALASDAEITAAYRAEPSWTANVETVEAVAVDRQGALAAMGTPGAVEANAPHVILFQVTGEFVARGVSVPPGSKAPVGSVLQLAYDVDSGVVLDSGYVDSPAALSGVGNPLVITR
jgi:hypothetical protein